MTGDGLSREPMLEMYLFEGSQLVEQLEEIIIECEKNKKIELESVNEIFRIMHTIKGSSAMMMFTNIALLAHSLEDLFYFIRENKITHIDYAGLSDLVLSGIDFVKGEITKIENDKVADGAPENLISAIDHFLEEMKASHTDNYTEQSASKEEEKTMYYISNYQKASSESGRKYNVRVFFEEDCQMQSVRAYMVIHNLKDIASEIFHFPENITDSAESDEIIKDTGFLVNFCTEVSDSEVDSILKQAAFIRKLEVEQVDEYPDIGNKSTPKRKEIILDEASEVVRSPQTEVIKEEAESQSGINNRQQSMISVTVTKLDMLMDIVGEIVISEAMVTRNPELEGLQLDGFQKAARQLRKLTDELQDIVMSIRMMPISMVFHKMNRIVRDMSKKLDKDVELEIIGETTEVDKNIIDQLSDPLMHLIRNAMDHGLESREGRIEAGKPVKGKIVLEAQSYGGDVLITIRDDGKGMSRESILKKARETGLVKRPENELSDKDVFSFILLPGFSTKDKITEFSGRGVGMDVVKKNLEKIGGNITIESTFGIGTEILVKIPLTLAIIDGIEINVGKSRYTIPTTSIRESFRMDANDIISDSDGNEMIMIRGQCYSVIRLHKLFNIKTQVTSISEGIMVMVETDTKAACLFVDKLVGEQQVVVKALPKYIKKVEGIAGCTILGDGGISLILDANGILGRE